MPGHSADTTADEVNTDTPKPALPLSKVYVEPTSRCNLMCRTCMRNVWDEPLGNMTPATFARVIDGLSAFDPPPAVFFGGIGEPLFHPGLVSMVRQAKAAGASVEAITNGTLLDERYARDLIAAGLDVLWVSLDGATPESYADVRLGAALPDVLANLARFQALCDSRRSPSPRMGIVFVAMKRNVAELPDMVRLAADWGVPKLRVQNLSHSFDDTGPEAEYMEILDFTAAEALWQEGDTEGRALAEESFAEARALAGRLGVALRLPSLGEGDRPARARGAPGCDWPWRSSYVRHDGKVQPCCMLMGDGRAILGDARGAGFEGAWRGPAYGAFRAALLSDAPPDVCRGCSMYRGVF